MDRTALGDRMKAYEAATRTRLPRRVYTILRLDGRAFHTYCASLDKPFDYQLIDDMDQVAVALCSEVDGTVFAYTQSDEISLLLSDFASTATQPWFGGEVQKITSVAASVATAHLNRLRYGVHSSRLATFDARVFTLTDPVDVANVFVWRQKDCVRNSVTMAAQSLFSERRLHGLATAARAELLKTEAGIDWEDYPPGARFGRVIYRQKAPKTVTTPTGPLVVDASEWVVRPAPQFAAAPGNFLAEQIPPLPSLAGTTS